MKKRFTDEKIIGFLKQADAGVAVRELCRQHGFSDASFYTWRAKFGGMTVPGVLLSGHHEEVRRWRRRAAIERTLDRRPDLLQGAQLDSEGRAIVEEIRAEREERDGPAGSSA